MRVTAHSLDKMLCCGWHRRPRRCNFPSLGGSLMATPILTPDRHGVVINTDLACGFPLATLHLLLATALAPRWPKDMMGAPWYDSVITTGVNNHDCSSSLQ